jgi:hypothetical protein
LGVKNAEYEQEMEMVQTEELTSILNEIVLSEGSEAFHKLVRFRKDNPEFKLKRCMLALGLSQDLIENLYGFKYSAGRAFSDYDRFREDILRFNLSKQYRVK